MLIVSGWPYLQNKRHTYNSQFCLQSLIFTSLSLSTLFLFLYIFLSFSLSYSLFLCLSLSFFPFSNLFFSLFLGSFSFLFSVLKFISQSTHIYLYYLTARWRAFHPWFWSLWTSIPFSRRIRAFSDCPFLKFFFLLTVFYIKVVSGSYRYVMDSYYS